MCVCNNIYILLCIYVDICFAIYIYIYIIICEKNKIFKRYIYIRILCQHLTFLFLLYIYICIKDERFRTPDDSRTDELS